ncbi:MAG: SH3 domain-containing protein [Bacteroidota bacterium]
MQRDSYRQTTLGLWGLVLMSLGLIVAIGCSGPKAQEGPITTEENSPYSALDANDSFPVDRVAICMWPAAGLRQEPGRNTYTSDKETNYITAIQYGEKVEVLPDIEPIEKENRLYMKVRLTDGKEGWVHDYIFERYAKLGVVTKETEIYRRPDLMTLRDTRLKPGQIIVVINDPAVPKVNANWYHVSSYKKIPKGWIHQGNHITMHIRDVRAALLLARAKGIRNKEKRLERLNEILATDGITESPIRPFISAAIQELDGIEVNEEELIRAGEKIYITKERTTIYSEPSLGQASVVKELREDDIVELIDVGERGSIGDHDDFWYKIRHEDTEGWVFGYYTSKRNLDSP